MCPTLAVLSLFRLLLMLRLEKHTPCPHLSLSPLSPLSVPHSFRDCRSLHVFTSLSSLSHPNTLLTLFSSLPSPLFPPSSPAVTPDKKRGKDKTREMNIKVSQESLPFFFTDRSLRVPSHAQALAFNPCTTTLPFPRLLRKHFPPSLPPFLLSSNPAFSKYPLHI